MKLNIKQDSAQITLQHIHNTHVIEYSKDNNGIPSVREKNHFTNRLHFIVHFPSAFRHFTHCTQANISDTILQCNIYELYKKIS